MANVLIMIFLFCVIWGIGDSFFNESNNEEVDINIENIDILSKKMEVLLESNQFKYFSYQNEVLKVEEIDIRTYWTNLSDAEYSGSEEICSGKEKGKGKEKKK